MVYDKLNPSSVLIESPILVLASLTVTSMFILAFLVISIKRQARKVRQKGKATTSSSKRPRDSKQISSNSRKSANFNEQNANNNNQILNFEFLNSMTYQKIKAELNKKKPNMEGQDQILNSELRKLNNKDQNNLITEQNQYNKDFLQENNGRNKHRESLSLSGPIVIQDLEQMDKQQKELNMQNQFLEKEMSSVERMSSIKSASGLLPSVFEIEEENKVNIEI